MQATHPTITEVYRSTRESYNGYPITTIIEKQTWPADAGIYAGKSYELGTVYHNGVITDSWSTPWTD